MSRRLEVDKGLINYKVENKYEKNYYKNYITICRYSKKFPGTATKKI